MEEHARAATEADLEVVGVLAQRAIDELRPHRGGAVWSRQTARPEPVEESIRAAWAAPDHHVTVGLIDDVVVGYAVVRFDVLRDGGRLAIIEDIYTEPEARAVGIGEALMDDALAWSREQGCFGIDALALPGDRETKNFFETAGLVARAIVVHRSLEP